jgi:hypothetical protein
MTLFISMIISALSTYFVNGWLEPFVEVSIRVMLDLVVFIAVYMFSNRYFKNMRD